MARTEARLLTSIWTDPDFIRLSVGAQWLYKMLLSQPGLSHAGTLDITLRRWASYSTSTTIEDIEKYLAELEGHPFVVIDWDTEELLIRSFLRNDEVYKQPNVMVAACKDAAAITSRALRAVLRDEVLRLPLTDEDKAKTTTRKMPLLDLIEQLLETLSEPSRTPPVNPSPNPSGKGFVQNPLANPEEIGEVVVVGLEQETKPTTTTKTLPQNQLASAREPPLFDEFYAAYPRHVAKADARKAWTKAVKKAPAETIIAGAKRYATEGREAQFIAYPASWLNSERWNDEAQPPRTNGRYSNDQWSDPDLEVSI